MYKFIIIFFIIIFTNHSYAEDKIVYLDVNYLLTQSDVGKYVNANLKKVNDKNKEEFKKLEIEIKSDEEKMLSQQNILKKEDYDNKISELRNKFKSYQENKKMKQIELNKLRNDSGNKILKNINEILTEYSKNNSISLVLGKKNIVIGKIELDVTNDILKLLNEKITLPGASATRAQINFGDKSKPKVTKQLVNPNSRRFKRSPMLSTRITCLELFIDSLADSSTCSG